MAKFKKKRQTVAPVVATCQICRTRFTSAYAWKRHRAMSACEVANPQRVNHEPVERD